MRDVASPAELLAEHDRGDLAPEQDDTGDGGEAEGEQQ